jgi:hypothetical protein
MTSRFEAATTASTLHPEAFMRPTRVALLAFLLALPVAPALALPCAGFTDVEDTSPFCPNVEWLRNRGVTLGCAANLYCPTAAVSRLAMAAFMNRLGTALTPAQYAVDVATGAVDLDGPAVVCQSADVNVAGYPRRALVDLAYAGHATAPVTFAADLVRTVDAGATWTPIGTQSYPGTVAAGGGWVTVANLASLDLDVGQVVRFGVRVGRAGVAGATDLDDGRCNLRVLVQSRDGTASPY